MTGDDATMNDNDVRWMDATDQAQLVRSGQISPTELVRTSIARIEALDPAVNAVIHPRFEAALHEAAALADDGGVRPFRGVPILLKDLGFCLAGEPDHQGSRVLRDAGFTSPVTDHAARKLVEAGFVVLGRTAVPELGLVCTSESAAYGPTRNPWDLTRTTGGSSGGSAAAVALGMVPLAQGTDGGGSVRMPSSYCGLIGLKPSRGRVSAGPTAPGALVGHNTFGPLGRSVRDVAAVLQIMSGWEYGDPTGPWTYDTSIADAPRVPPARLRIGVLEDALVDDRSRDALTDFGRWAADAGHMVEASHPERLLDEDFVTHFERALAPEVALFVEYLSAELGRTIEDPEFEPITQRWIGVGRTLSAVQHRSSIAWLDAYRLQVHEWWREHDVLALPAAPHPAPPLGWFHDAGQGVERSLQHVRWTAPFNSTGQPGAAAPMGIRDGLPIGIQLVAAPGREATLVSLLAEIETAGTLQVALEPTGTS